MRPSVVFHHVIAVLIILPGCRASGDSVPPAATQVSKSPATTQSLLKHKPTKIETPEFIRLLETGDLIYIETRHSQTIIIRLVDGREFEGVYRQPKSGPYSDVEKFFDIANLAGHIVDTRTNLKHRVLMGVA